MAHAAIAFAKQRLRRQIYAVTTSVGPGSANLTAAAGTALANNIPVLLLPSDTFATRQPDPVLQQVEHESNLTTTTNDALKAVSRYWDRVTRPEQLMSSLIRAFEVLTNPAQAGPATVCISQDVQGEAFDFDESFFEKRVHYIDRPEPVAREIDLMIETIKIVKSQSYLLVVARNIQARDELIEISDKYNIPLVETQAGKSTVEATFKHNLGGMGITGTLAANKVAYAADLVIGIGTRYTDFATSSKTAFDFDKTKFLNINVNRMQAYKLDAVQVVADAKVTLQHLLKRLGDDYQTGYGESINEVKTEWLNERSRLSQIQFNREHFDPEIKEQFDQNILNEYADALGTELTQSSVVLKLNEVVSPDSNVITSAGLFRGLTEIMECFCTEHLPC